MTREIEAIEALQWIADTAYEAFGGAGDSDTALSTINNHARAVLKKLDKAASLSAEWRATQAARDVLAERRRQVEVEGWTAEHDDREHRRDELAKAAACYAAGEAIFKAEQRAGTRYAPFTLYVPLWPFDDRWWKPKDRRRDLVKAGALILAEIERLDRASPPEKSDEGDR